MPRKPFVCDPLVPYHLVARTNDRKWFDVPMAAVWSIFAEQLYFLHSAFEVRILSFVLMGNHFHLIAKFPEGNFGDAMRSFMGTTSRVISFEAGTSNHLYGARVFRSRLGSYHYFMNAYKYVYQNPLRAGCCERAEDYRFSTLHGLLGQSQLLMPLEEDSVLYDDVEETLRWLNVMPNERDVDVVRKALRRADFRFSKDESNRAHRLESELL